MITTALKIGPADQGRAMTLEEFTQAETQEGYLYELGRGVLAVSDVPNRRHVVQVITIRRQLNAYELAHPERISALLTGSECKIPVAGLQSERHPDLAVYCSPMPEGEDLWATWVPEIVIEVVSLGSEHRDYVEKREEYLLFGVREYWIFDAERGELLVLRRTAGRWQERVVRAPAVYRTPLLPGFALAVAPVFEAAQAVVP
jgi:Uma2 family endonuclease